MPFDVCPSCDRPCNQGTRPINMHEWIRALFLLFESKDNTSLLNAEVLYTYKKAYCNAKDNNKTNMNKNTNKKVEI